MKFLVLRRTDPSTGKKEYCTHAGYYWSEDICNAKQYSKPGSVKSLATTAKASHKRHLAERQNGNIYYNSFYIPLQYIYHIVPVEKTITEDNINATII